MLKFLGKFGKGWATWSGVVITATGVLLGTDAAQDVAGVTDGVAQAVASAGALLAAFGYGRKTGYKATER